MSLTEPRAFLSVVEYRQMCIFIWVYSSVMPKNYRICTKPVGEIIKRHNINYNCYADGIQLHKTLKPGENWGKISSSTEASIADVGNWMNY